MNNLIPSIINCNYTIFMQTHCTYFTNNAIYLILFPSLSKIKGSQFLFVNIRFFVLTNVLFCFFLFTDCCGFSFGFLCLVLKLDFCRLWLFFLGYAAISFCKVKYYWFQIFPYVDLEKLTNKETFNYKRLATLCYFVKYLLFSTSPHDQYYQKKVG